MNPTTPITTKSAATTENTAVAPAAIPEQQPPIVSVDPESLDLVPKVHVDMHEPEDPTLSMQDVFMQDGELSAEKINKFTGGGSQYSTLFALIDYGVGMRADQVEIHKAYDYGEMRENVKLILTSIKEGAKSDFGERVGIKSLSLEDYFSALLSKLEESLTLENQALTSNEKAELTNQLYESKAGGAIDSSFIAKLEVIRTSPTSEPRET